MVGLWLGVAWGCSCFVTKLSEEVGAAELVVVGRVVEVEGFDVPMVLPFFPPERDSWDREVVVAVEEGLLGADPGDQVVVETGWGGGDCGIDVKEGDALLVVSQTGFFGSCDPSMVEPHTRLLEALREEVAAIPVERRRALHGKYVRLPEPERSGLVWAGVGSLFLCVGIGAVVARRMRV